MRFLGFDIKRRKKSDLLEVDVFKKTVEYINNLCEGYIKLLKDGVELNPESMATLLDMIECLRSLTELYSRNKFSAPSAAFKIGDEANKVFKDTFKFVETVMSMKCIDSLSVALSKLKSEMSEEEINEMSDDEFDEFVSSIPINSSKMFEQKLDGIAGRIIINLKAIHHTIIFDMIRIQTGVDIIDDYHKSIKIKNSEYDTVYKFTMCKPHKDSEDSDEKGDVKTNG